MVSDQEIANGVASLLRQSDPNVVRSVNGVVQQLEAKLGLDLSHKAAFIRDQIELLLGSPTHHRPPHHPKDHFALQHHSQFQNSHQLHHPIPSSPFQPPPSLHHHELGGGFRCLPPQQPQQQQQQQTPPQHQPQHLQMSQPQVQPQQPLPQPTGPAAIAVPESPKESTQTGGKRRGGPGGLNKVCGVSPLLQTIVGSPALPRTEIVKQLWAYIRKNNLQDPSNKRKIICNDALRLVFETDCTDMFKMNKLLAKHIIPLEPSKESGPDAKRLKAADMESAAESNEPSPSLVIISDALAKFFGTGEREMLHSDAVRRVWEYIEVNHLEDPRGAVVVCDAKLRALFGCESLPMLGISEMLMHHFFKRS